MNLFNDEKQVDSGCAHAALLRITSNIDKPPIARSPISVIPDVPAIAIDEPPVSGSAITVPYME